MRRRAVHDGHGHEEVDMAETSTMAVDPSNSEQARAWDGDEGAYWATHAERFDRALDAYRSTFLAAASIQPKDHVLDVGCGAGGTTRDVARLAADGSVLGVDLSSDMLRVARSIAAAEGVHNATFLRADAQIHPFGEGSFDALVSRTGTMFFGDPDAAFANLARALRPGGQLTMLVWQPAARNEWFLEFTTAMAAGRDLPPPPADAGPFSLGEPARVSALLVRAGFDEPEIFGVEEPMWFGPDPDESYEFIAGLLAWMVVGLDDEGRARAADALRATMTRHAGPDGVTFGSATWIVTAHKRSA